MKLISIIYLSSLLTALYAAGCADYAEDVLNCPATIDGECCANTIGVCEQVSCPTTTCICPTYPAFTPLPTKAGKSKDSKPIGNGIGACDCNGGVAELRYVYLGTTSNVQIDIYTGKSKDSPQLVCTFNNIQPNEEIVCNLRGDASGLVLKGLDKFATESPFIITYPNGNTCNAQYHTSCSQDIVGVVQSECPELVVSGWKDNNNYDNGLDCDDGIVPCQCGNINTTPNTTPNTPIETSVDIIIGDKCYCQSITSNGFSTTATATATVPKSKAKKSKAKSKGKSKDNTGFGVGDCDCEGGQIELTIMYQGIEDVNIEFFYKDMTLICTENNVSQGDEITCNVQNPNGLNAPIYDKLGTNTYVKLRRDNNIEICTSEIHTSCSRDIVGTYGDNGCGMDIIVTGWRDKNNLIDGLNCDDGFELCQCDTDNTLEPDNEPDNEPTQEPLTTVTNINEDVCFCGTLSPTDLITTTLKPSKGSKSKGSKSKGSKSKGSKSKGSKSKGSKSKSKDNGNGYGGCDCDGGVNMLRFVYKGIESPVDITLFYDGLDSEIICTINDVLFGDENECSLDIDGPFDPNTNDLLYSKLQKETFVRISNGNTYICEGQWHTSCSKDIVGWTSDGCADIIITGWKGNNNIKECDDGFEPCQCDTEEPTTTIITTTTVINESDEPDDCNKYSIVQIEGGLSDCESTQNCYVDVNICKTDNNAPVMDKSNGNAQNDFIRMNSVSSGALIGFIAIIVGCICITCVICVFICVRKKNKKERDVLRKGMEVINDKGEGKGQVLTVPTHGTDTNILMKGDE